MKSKSSGGTTRILTAVFLAAFSFVSAGFADVPSANPALAAKYARFRLPPNLKTNTTSVALPNLQSQTRRPISAPPPPDEIGPHHRAWIIPAEVPEGFAPVSNGPNLGPARSFHPPAQRIEERATGMNFWDGTNWSPSVPVFEQTADGFLAQRVQHHLTLANELNVAGAVTVTLQGGLVIQSTPLAIGLYDVASGNSTVIATLTNSVGVLVSSNSVLYENAFNQNGVKADVIFNLERGAYSQNIVFGPKSIQWIMDSRPTARASKF